jgi:hypothetical protein
MGCKNAKGEKPLWLFTFFGRKYHLPLKELLFTATIIEM